jgi:hypothetical protein
LKTLNGRGQIFSTDLMMAAVVFLFILTMSIIYSGEVANRVYFLEENQARDQAALRAADAIVLSSGNPANWETLSSLDSASSLGIAQSRNVLDEGKLLALLDLNAGNYSRIKDLLGASRYGLGISVLRLQNKQSLAEFGMQPGSEKNVSVVSRIALYQGEEVIVRVKVFE